MGVCSHCGPGRPRPWALWRFWLALPTGKKEAEAAIGSAEQEAKRIVSDAIKTSEAKKKEAILEGKDEIHRLRNESEKELNDRRKEIQRQERRVQQKEENLDRKMASLEAKEEAVAKKNKKAEERLQEAEAVKKSQFEVLETDFRLHHGTGQRIPAEKPGK